MRWLQDVLPPEVVEAQHYWSVCRSVFRMLELGIPHGDIRKRYPETLPGRYYLSAMGETSPLEKFLQGRERFSIPSRTSRHLSDAMTRALDDPELQELMRERHELWSRTVERRRKEAEGRRLKRAYDNKLHQQRKRRRE